MVELRVCVCGYSAQGVRGGEEGRTVRGRVDAW